MAPLLFAAQLLAVEAEAPAAASPPWWLYGGIAAAVVVGGLAALMVALRRGGGTEAPCPACGRVMMPDWPRCMFCKTPRGFRPASLEVVSGPLAGRVIALDGDVTTIGSAPGSSVVLGDAGVSRKHAGIRRLDGAYELADLGSTNGVYVNGDKVARHRLRVGDVVRVGATEMVFRS